MRRVTVTENPDGQLLAAQAVPAVVGWKHVGAAGTSTVVYVGIPIEDVLVTTGNNSAADFFHSTLVYAGRGGWPAGGLIYGEGSAPCPEKTFS
jgi:hypothetical protein